MTFVTQRRKSVLILEYRSRMSFFLVYTLLEVYNKTIFYLLSEHMDLFLLDKFLNLQNIEMVIKDEKKCLLTSV